MQTRTLFATLALLLAPLAAQEKHTLRYTFTPGSVCWSQMDQEVVQDMDMGTRKMHTSMTSSTWMESKVSGVDKGVATLTNRYARIKVKSDAPGMKIDYDSDVEGSRPGAMRQMADLVGKVATMKTDTRGKIMEITFPEDMGDAFESLATSLKAGMEQSFVYFPEEAVAIGDTWQTHLEIPMDKVGAMKVVATNKLTAVNGDTCKVDISMSFDTSGLAMPGGMQLTVKESSGSMTVSTQHVVPVESTMKMVMKMGSAEAGVDMTMSMNMTMKQVPAPAPKPAAEKKADGK
ncbi:MAG: hypothetical protein K8J09_22930 [Planctomycetes bacterium]|nr:hypothetical protein [Planctomycetota bacterium]MCC7398949.1 hypothetical protein [Planctomycetota bacterium]